MSHYVFHYQPCSQDLTVQVHKIINNQAIFLFHVVNKQAIKDIVLNKIKENGKAFGTLKFTDFEHKYTEYTSWGSVIMHLANCYFH